MIYYESRPSNYGYQAVVFTYDKSSNEVVIYRSVREFADEAEALDDANEYLEKNSMTAELV